MADSWPQLFTLFLPSHILLNVLSTASMFCAQFGWMDFHFFCLIFWYLQSWQPWYICRPNPVCVEFAPSPCDPVIFLLVIWFPPHRKDVMVGRLTGRCHLPLMCRWVLESEGTVGVSYCTFLWIYLRPSFSAFNSFQRKALKYLPCLIAPEVLGSVK